MNVDLLNEFRSPHDGRDFIVESNLNPNQKFPSSLDLRPDMPEVWDQGSDGPCSAYSAAAIKTWQEKIDYGLDRELSYDFVYDLRSNKPQSGMFARDTMKILQKYGIPSRETYSKGVNRKDAKKKNFIPSDDILKESAKHKIRNYALVSTIDGLKQSLYKFGPCYITMPVFNGSPRFWKPGFKENMLGGHALVVVGYNSRAFILRNSWGKDWAYGGHTFYPYSDWGAHWEVWSLFDIDSDRIKPVPLLKRFF